MNNKLDNQHPANILSVRIKEGSFILLIALAIFLFISLFITLYTGFIYTANTFKKALN